MPLNRASSLASGIGDNYERGTVGDFLKEKFHEGSTLSIVSAYFTIFAFEELKQSHSNIQAMSFLFGEPLFLKSIDPSKTDKKAFNIEDDSLKLQNRLEQKRVAKDCAAWLAEKAEIRYRISHQTAKN